MVEAPAVPKKLEDLVPMMQQVQADLTRLADSVAEVQDSYMRVKYFHKVIGVTEGDVTVGAGGGAAIRFPEAGQTSGWRSLIASGKIVEVMIANTGQNPAYLSFNRDASNGSPFVIPAGTGVSWSVQIDRFISLCSTDADNTTTVRVAVFGD